jgi:hypothetical protein
LLVTLVYRRSFCIGVKLTTGIILIFFAANQSRLEKHVVDRSKFYELDEVSIFDLQLDSQNPRIRHGADQHDCIERIAEDRDSFLRLMKDIAANGLSPEHILLSKSAEGKLIVRDGNRRVTALKLLNRPDLALPDEGLRNLVFRIAGAAATPIGYKVDCLVCEDETTILDYLRRKHTGENGGIGQVGWSALLIALFNVHAAITDQNRRAAQLILWMEERGKHVTNEFPITTLTRLLNAETLAILGFSIQDDKLVAILPDANAYVLAARILDDIASNLVSVSRNGAPGTISVYSLDAALEYVRYVRRELGPADAAASTPDVAVPDPIASVPPNGKMDGAGQGAPVEGAAGDVRGTSVGAVAGIAGQAAQGGGGSDGGSVDEPMDVAGQGAPTGAVGEGGQGAPGAGQPDGGDPGFGDQSGASGSQQAGPAQPATAPAVVGASVKPGWDRPCLFGRRKNSRPDLAIPTDRRKALTIVSELRALDPFATPMAVTMLLRALLELSDGEYRKALQMKDHGALHKNMAASASRMLNDGLLTNAEHHVIQSYTRSEESFNHVRAIQKYIHDDIYHPNGQSLNTIWDSIGCFAKACWVGVTRAAT